MNESDEVCDDNIMTRVFQLYIVEYKIKFFDDKS